MESLFGRKKRCRPGTKRANREQKRGNREQECTVNRTRNAPAPFTELPHEEGLRRLKALEQIALPIVSAGRIGKDTEDCWPLVRVDLSARPDVSDLARVHRFEGAGDQRSYWDFGFIPDVKAFASVTIYLERPVKCWFCILFDLVDHAPVLNRIADRGGFILTDQPSTAGAAAIMDNAVFWRCPVDDLRQVMATVAVTADLMRAGHGR